MTTAAVSRSHPCSAARRESGSIWASRSTVSGYHCTMRIRSAAWAFGFALPCSHFEGPHMQISCDTALEIHALAQRSSHFRSRNLRTGVRFRSMRSQSPLALATGSQGIQNPRSLHETDFVPENCFFN